MAAKFTPAFERLLKNQAWMSSPEYIAWQHAVDEYDAAKPEQAREKASKLVAAKRKAMEVRQRIYNEPPAKTAA